MWWYYQIKKKNQKEAEKRRNKFGKLNFVVYFCRNK